jgi:hypothetical protein
MLNPDPAFEMWILILKRWIRIALKSKSEALEAQNGAVEGL